MINISLVQELGNNFDSKWVYKKVKDMKQLEKAVDFFVKHGHLKKGLTDIDYPTFRLIGWKEPRQILVRARKRPKDIGGNIVNWYSIKGLINDY